MKSLTVCIRCFSKYALFSVFFLSKFRIYSKIYLRFKIKLYFFQIYKFFLKKCSKIKVGIFFQTTARQKFSKELEVHVTQKLVFSKIYHLFFKAFRKCHMFVLLSPLVQNLLNIFQKFCISSTPSKIFFQRIAILSNLFFFYNNILNPPPRFFPNFLV